MYKKPYSLNMLPSPYDSRDYHVSDFFYSTINKHKDIQVPKVLDFRKDFNPVRDQGIQGSCYAFAASAMKEWEEKQDYQFNGYMSPQFLYNNRSNLYDGNDYDNDGMFSRDVMKLLSTIGICPENEYRYGRIETKDKIPKKIYEDAKINRIKSYARIYTIDEMKKSLCMHGPCLITIPVYDHSIRMWKKSYPNQQMIGGHAMCVVGYNERGMIIRNSWGPEWGINGYTIFPYEDWGLFWELWACVDRQSYEHFEKNTLLDFLKKWFGFCF